MRVFNMLLWFRLFREYYIYEEQHRIFKEGQQKQIETEIRERNERRIESERNDDILRIKQYEKINFNNKLRKTFKGLCNETIECNCVICNLS